MQVRRIGMNLRPSILDDLGLLATFEWFIREYQRTYPGIRIKKQTEIEETQVPDPHKAVIYRILQEAMNNIAKHSKANLVNISLLLRNGCQPDFLCFSKEEIRRDRGREI